MLGEGGKETYKGFIQGDVAQEQSRRDTACHAEAAGRSGDKGRPEVRHAQGHKQEILLVCDIVGDHEGECLESEEPRDRVTDSFEQLVPFQLLMFDAGGCCGMNPMDKVYPFRNSEEVCFSRVVGIEERDEDCKELWKGEKGFPIST